MEKKNDKIVYVYIVLGYIPTDGYYRLGFAVYIYVYTIYINNTILHIYIPICPIHIRVSPSALCTVYNKRCSFKMFFSHFNSLIYNSKSPIGEHHSTTKIIIYFKRDLNA